MASSRVGTSTSAAIPGVLSLSSFSITGIRNASVLPVPVCAVAITSLPASACGIAAACTGVGVVNRAAANLSFTYEEICISANRSEERSGRGPEARSVRGSEERSAFTSETFNIQYYFLTGRSRRGTHTSSWAAGGLLCQSCFRLRVKRTEETGGGESQIKHCTRGTAQHNRGIKRRGSIPHLDSRRGDLIAGTVIMLLFHGPNRIHIMTLSLSF